MIYNPSPRDFLFSKIFNMLVPMEITATKNWSHNSFEQAMEYFTPLLKADWMTHLKIMPVEYSEWSDTLYIIVEFDVTPEAKSDIMALNFHSKERFIERMGMYIKNYFQAFLNTNVGIKDYIAPANYVHN
jgi:hypothetical protein